MVACSTIYHENLISIGEHVGLRKSIIFTLATQNTYLNVVSVGMAENGYQHNIQEQQGIQASTWLPDGVRILCKSDHGQKHG